MGKQIELTSIRHNNSIFIHGEHIVHTSIGIIERIEMDLEGGGWIGTTKKFNSYLAILGYNAEYEGEPNNCKDDTMS
mgnify:CR=1 FL=1